MSTRKEIEKALAFFNDDDIEPLIRAAVFYFGFVYIHPFYDGNGRMDRFMNSYLISHEFSHFREGWPSRKEARWKAELPLHGHQKAASMINKDDSLPQNPQAR